MSELQFASQCSPEFDQIPAENVVCNATLDSITATIELDVDPCNDVIKFEVNVSDVNDVSFNEEFMYTWEYNTLENSTLISSTDVDGWKFEADVESSITNTLNENQISNSLRIEINFDMCVTLKDIDDIPDNTLKSALKTFETGCGISGGSVLCDFVKGSRVCGSNFNDVFESDVGKQIKNILNDKLGTIFDVSGFPLKLVSKTLSYQCVNPAGDAIVKRLSDSDPVNPNKGTSIHATISNAFKIAVLSTAATSMFALL